MTPQSNTATAKLMALALFGAMAAAVGFGVVGPVWDRYGMAIEKTLELRQELAGYQQVARQAESLRTLLDKPEADDGLGSLVMTPASDGVVTARMQSRMERIIEKAGARLSSVQALPPQPMGGLRRIGLRLLFAADTGSVRTIFHALEYGRPVTVLDNIFIHARSEKAVGTVLPLTVRLDVFAFLPGED